MELKYLVLSEEQMQNLARLGLDISDADKSFGGYRRYTLNEVELKIGDFLFHSNVSNVFIQVDKHGTATVSIEMSEKGVSKEKGVNIKSEVAFLALDLYYLVLCHLLSSWKGGDVQVEDILFQEKILLKE